MERQPFAAANEALSDTSEIVDAKGQTDTLLAVSGEAIQCHTSCKNVAGRVSIIDETDAGPRVFTKTQAPGQQGIPPGATQLGC